MYQVAAQFTKHIVSSTAHPCYKTTCPVIIPAGSPRYYIKNSEDLDAPGKYVCKSCLFAFQRMTGTVIYEDVPPNSPEPPQENIADIRRGTNESQRMGAHTPQGRVTSMPPGHSVPHPGVPSRGSGGVIVAQPLHNPPSLGRTHLRTPVTTTYNVSGGNAIGYSSEHAFHSQAMQDWQRLSRAGNTTPRAGLPQNPHGYAGGPLGNFEYSHIRVNIVVYQPHLDNKSKPQLVPLCNLKETLIVVNSISSGELCTKIYEKMQKPMQEYLAQYGVSFPIEEMAVRESTGGIWLSVNQSDFDNTHFVNHHLIKAVTTGPQNKKVTTYKMPKDPFVFGIVIPLSVWSEIEDYEQREIFQKLDPRAAAILAQQASRSIPVKRTTKTAKKGPTKKVKLSVEGSEVETSESLARHSESANSESDVEENRTSHDHNHTTSLFLPATTARTCQSHATSPAPSSKTWSVRSDVIPSNVQPVQPTSQRRSSQCSAIRSQQKPIASQVGPGSAAATSSSAAGLAYMQTSPQRGMIQRHGAQTMPRHVETAFTEIPLPGIRAHTEQHGGDTGLLSGKTFVPLNIEVIRQGLSQGGVTKKKKMKDMDNPPISEPILFYPLPSDISFNELLQAPERAVILANTDPLNTEQRICFNARLTYELHDQLGKGSFKTALVAVLDLTSSTPSVGLGSKVLGQPRSSVMVALKRPYIPMPEGPPAAVLAPAQSRPSTRSSLKPAQAAPPPKPASTTSSFAGLKRLSYCDEMQSIINEAKLLVWANALLKWTYQWINDKISSRQASSPLPPFIQDIPSFRFVEGAIAIALKEVEMKKTTGKPSGHRAVYMLEELLPRRGAGFVKYINNAKAVSLLDTHEPDYHLAEFLLFTQHVQYVITAGMAYISDLQGVETTLTDPQLMTHPAIGKNLFGGGNLQKAFNNFTHEHVCNRYCHWFGLDPLTVCSDAA